MHYFILKKMLVYLMVTFFFHMLVYILYVSLLSKMLVRLLPWYSVHRFSTFPDIVFFQKKKKRLEHFLHVFFSKKYFKNLAAVYFPKVNIGVYFKSFSYF